MIRSIILWLRRKFAKDDGQECQCGHMRCMHEKGKHHCHEVKQDSQELGKACRCQKFIKDNGGGRGKRNEDPMTPSPEYLERLYGVKK